VILPGTKLLLLLLLLSASPVIRGRHSESSRIIDLAHVLGPDALPDATLTIYPGLGPAIEILYLAQNNLSSLNFEAWIVKLLFDVWANIHILQLLVRLFRT